MGGYEEAAGCNKKEEEQGRGKGFIRKIDEGSYEFEYRIVRGTEVIHAVLQVSHVAEKILGHFGSRFDDAGRSERRAAHGIG